MHVKEGVGASGVADHRPQAACPLPRTLALAGSAARRLGQSSAAWRSAARQLTVSQDHKGQGAREPAILSS